MGIFNAMDVNFQCNIKFDAPFNYADSISDNAVTMYFGSEFNGNVTFPNSLYNGRNHSRAYPYVELNIYSTFSRMNNFNGLVKFPTNPNIGFVGNAMHETFMYSKNFNKPVVIPNGITDLTDTFCKCASFNQPVIIPNSVVRLGYYSLSSTSGMFAWCSNFNYAVTIPDTDHEVSCSGMFAYCSNLNSLINIGNNVTSCSGMFRGCHNFNRSVIIPNNVESCYHMFMDCYSFNHPVTIPDSVIYISAMFARCVNLDSDIHIGNGVIDCSGLFSNGLLHLKNNPFKFNGNVYIGKNVNNCSSMFNASWRYNSNVTFGGNNISNCYNMFHYCDIFNKPVNFANQHNMQNMAAAFAGCPNLNSPITLPTHTIFECDFSGMFAMCNEFNQPVTFPNNARSCTSVFSDCPNFNQPLHIPSTVNSVAAMVMWCDNFNQSITFEPNSRVESTARLFSGDKNYNLPIVIPNSVTNTSNMFYGCKDFCQDITIPDGVTNAYGMFYNTLMYRKNIVIPASVKNLDYFLKSSESRANYSPGSMTFLHTSAEGIVSTMYPSLIPTRFVDPKNNGVFIYDVYVHSAEIAGKIYPGLNACLNGQSNFITPFPDDIAWGWYPSGDGYIYQTLYEAPWPNYDVCGQLRVHIV